MRFIDTKNDLIIEQSFGLKMETILRMLTNNEKSLLRKVFNISKKNESLLYYGLNNFKKCPPSILLKIMNLIIKQLPKNLQTKLNKTEIAPMSSNALTLRRIKRNKRVMILFEPFMRLCVENGITTLTNFDSHFKNGLIIVLLNYDYFKNKNNDNPLIHEILNRIGSDRNVSSIVQISKIYNGIWISDKEIKKLVKLVEKESVRLKWSLLSKVNEINDGNKYWHGHYCIDTTGGQRSGSKKGCIQLANDIIDYCSTEDLHILKYRFVYMMSFSKNSYKIFNCNENVRIFRDAYKHYFSDHTDMIDYIDAEKEELRCCISLKLISADHFLNDCCIEVCHIKPRKSFPLSVSYEGKILTAYNISNLYWGFQTANHMQGNMSIHMFINSIAKILIRYLRTDMVNLLDEDVQEELKQQLL